MSKTIIAVGGTGQEIALACLRMAHLANIELPFVILIDADQGSGGNTGLRTRTEELQDLERFLKTAYGLPKLLALAKPLANNIKARNLSDMASLFASAGKVSGPVGSVLSVLFAEKQQRTSIVDGFHGQPTVGAVAVCDQFLHARPDDGDHVLQIVEERTRPGEAHFVVLAGSTTGGTGPGTIPPLSKKLIEWRSSRHPERSIEVSGLVQLQWFEPREDGEISWSRKPDIDLVRLQRNSACLVRQYHSGLESMLDRLILLSLPRIVGRTSAGANHQPETLHWLNVLSGWIANELLYYGATMANLPRGKLYGFALQEDRSVENLRFELPERVLSVEEALKATLGVERFGNALQSQLRAGRPDIAMPKAVYGLAARLHKKGGGSAIEEFVRQLSELLAGDKRATDWFFAACASRLRPDGRSPRDPSDIGGAFLVDKARLEAGASWRAYSSALEHKFAGDLLQEVGVQSLPEPPQDAAVEVYRRVRKKSLAQPAG